MIEKVISDKDIVTVAALADEIWHEHYAGILSAAQIDYMVAKFQSAEAVKESIEKQGYEYYFICSGGEKVGYIGLKKEKNKLFVSKLYISSSARGKGLGREGIEFCSSLAAENGLKTVYLTVNKFNPSEKFYEKLGFTVAEKTVTDIGNGFVMDDFVMEKRV